MLAASLLTGLLFAAVDAEAVLSQAEATFREGGRLREWPSQARAQFNAAAEAYGTLQQSGCHNVDLHRNQGNAYLLAGDLPRALLAYRRGLRLSPYDVRLRAALDHARGQVVYPPHSSLGRPAPEHWPPWLPRPSPTLWFWLAALAYGLGCAAATRWLMVRRGPLPAAAASALGVAILASAVMILEERRLQQIVYQPFAVVAEDEVLLRKGNGLGYPLRADVPLNRGVEAWLLFSKGDWLQVELAGGEVGWLPREYALVDVP